MTSDPQTPHTHLGVSWKTTLLSLSAPVWPDVQKPTVGLAHVTSALGW